MIIEVWGDIGERLAYASAAVLHSSQSTRGSSRIDPSAIGLGLGVALTLSGIGCGGVTGNERVHAPATPATDALVADSAVIPVAYFRRGSDIHESMLDPHRDASGRTNSARHNQGRGNELKVADQLKLQVNAVCVQESVADRQPTCNFDAADAGRGVKLRQAGARGSLRWCAGDEPLPWISSARAAKLDVSYRSLGLSTRPAVAGAEIALGAPIGHHFVLASILGHNALIATDGSVSPLRTIGNEALTPNLLAGGVYPPTKGTSLLRMPESDEPIFRINFDGTTEAIPRPEPMARYLGWTTSGGGQDSLWRWPTPRGGEVWAVAHHRVDGTIVGEPEQFPAPALCSSLPEVSEAELSEAPRFRVDRLDGSGARHGGHPSRGIRIAQVRTQGRSLLCVDHARDHEDHQFWRADRSPELRSAGSVKVTCDRWALEHPSAMHASAGR